MRLIQAARVIHRGAALIAASALALPCRDGVFDWVLSNQVIEHVTDARLLLKEACRVLRVGGRLLLTTPNRRSHLVTRRPVRFLQALAGRAKSDFTHVHEFVPRELRSTIRDAGFHIEVEEAIGRNSHVRWLRPFCGGTLVIARR